MEEERLKELKELKQVREIYREVDNRPIERNCTRLGQCCQFQLTGKKPLLTKGEALLAHKAFRATGRKSIPTKTDGSCPFLDSTKRTCLIYDSRPFGCRTHFCSMAGGPYSRNEVLDLIRKLEVIDQSLGGDGSHEIVTALNLALKD